MAAMAIWMTLIALLFGAMVFFVLWLTVGPTVK
jgi:hypothetical protein